MDVFSTNDVRALTDFHSHVLPAMDDGARDADTSAKMLSSLHDQGVNAVFATPHFLESKESVDSFLCRREKAFEQLSGLGAAIPQILLGAEIRVMYGIANTDLSPLLLQGTRALLFELPAEELSHGIINEIRGACSRDYYIPIIAHIDRYTWYKSKDIDLLCDIPDVVFQVNLRALRTLKGRALVRKLHRQGQRTVFGSDCHDTDSRSPDMYILTDKDKKSPLLSSERKRLLSAHMQASEFILDHTQKSSSGLIF